jgi:hypothetical protein
VNSKPEDDISYYIDADGKEQEAPHEVEHKFTDRKPLRLQVFPALGVFVLIMSDTKIGEEGTTGVMQVYRTRTFELLFKRDITAHWYAMENSSNWDPYSTDYDIYKYDKWISRADIYLTSNDKHALISLYLYDRLIIQRFKISRTQWTPEPEKTVTVDPWDGYLKCQEGFIYQ